MARLRKRLEEDLQSIWWRLSQDGRLQAARKKIQSKGQYLEAAEGRN